MQFIKNDNSKYFSPRYDIKGVEDKPAPNQLKGIAGYGQIWGWILKKLGFAIALKDEKNNTFYLNKVSASKWLNRNEDKCDPADKKKLYKKIHSLAIQKTEKASPNRVQEQIDLNAVNLEDLPRDVHLLISKELAYKDLSALSIASRGLQKNTFEELLTKKLLALNSEEDPTALIDFVKDNLGNQLSYVLLKDFSAERKWVIFKILSPIWRPLNLHPFNSALANAFLKSPIAHDLGFQLAKDFLENPEKFPPSLPESDQLTILQICYFLYAKSVGAFDTLLKKYSGNFRLTGMYAYSQSYKDEFEERFYRKPDAQWLLHHLSVYCKADEFIKQLNNFEKVPERVAKEMWSDHRILTHLISGLTTKEALKGALQEISQLANQEHKDWYLQALTKGIKRQDSTGNIKEFLPNLTQDEIEDILQELGIVERAKELALLGGDEYHKLFGLRISEDPNAPPVIPFKGHLYG